MGKWKSKLRNPSGDALTTTGQYSLVILGTVMSFKTVDVSSGERPFNINMRGSVPVMSHSTVFPSISTTTRGCQDEVEIQSRE